MQLSGLRLGLASEGSFVPGPLGSWSWNLEIVILVDDERGIGVVGRAQDIAQHFSTPVATPAELADAARSAGFPDHGVVLRLEHAGTALIRKGLRDRGSLHATFDELRSAASGARVLLENDLRAHMHPTRMTTIAAATEDLLQRVLRTCPACGSPGHGLIEKLPGLPCRDCGEATHEVRAEVHGCVACGQRELRERAARHGDPANCESCNP